MREYNLVINKMKNHSTAVVDKTDDKAIRWYMARCRRQIASARAFGIADEEAISEKLDEMAKVADFMKSSKYVIL